MMIFDWYLKYQYSSESKTCKPISHKFTKKKYGLDQQNTLKTCLFVSLELMKKKMKKEKKELLMSYAMQFGTYFQIYFSSNTLWRKE